MTAMSEEQVAWAKAMVEDPRWEWVPGMAFAYEDNLKDVLRHTYGAARIPNTCLPDLNDEATQAILLFQVLMREAETVNAEFFWDGEVEIDGVGPSGDLVAVLAEAWLGSVAFERVQERLKEARRNRVTLVNGFFNPETDTLAHLSVSGVGNVWRAFASLEEQPYRTHTFEGVKEAVMEWCQRLRDAAGW